MDSLIPQYKVAGDIDVRGLIFSINSIIEVGGQNSRVADRASVFRAVNTAYVKD